jgi:polysaccharide export outer membrane protein
MHLSKFTYFFLLLSAIFLFSSCGNLRYLKNKQASHTDTISYEKHYPEDYKLKPGDLLSVKIYTYNENINEVLSIGTQQSNAGNSQQGENMYYSGYMVNDSGFIDLPVIGSLYIEGKSTAECRETINNRAQSFFDDPIVVVKTAGIRIACLGEFNSEGIITIPREKIDIYDAVSFAGGLTEYADKRNIKIIRNEKGYYKEYLIDLTTPRTLTDKKLYVFNDDKIIADPVKMKIIRRNIQEFTFIFSVISSTVTTTVLLINLQNNQK